MHPSLSKGRGVSVINAYVTETEVTISAKSEKEINVLYLLWEEKWWDKQNMSP